MCGIVGFIGKKPPVKYTGTEKKRFMWEGLYSVALRGMDATGIAFIRDAQKQPTVYKRALPAYDFLQSRMIDKILTDCDQSVAVLGHTRAATRGWISDENAHPFQFDHITLVHNGHVNNYRGLRAKTDSEVDSAHVAAALAERDELEVLSELSGDFAFVYHNAKEGTVNIARNDGRPLFWASVAGWDGYAFCSELEMLGFLLARQGLKIKEQQMVYPEPNFLYKFDITEAAKGVAYVAVPFPQKKTTTTVPLGTGGNTAAGIGTTKEVKDRIDLYRSKIRTIKKAAVDNIVTNSRPASERATEKATRRLKELKIKFNGTWGARPRDWIPYPFDKDRGVMVVEFIGQLKGILGEVHNISEETFDVMFELNHSAIVIPVNVRSYAKKELIVCCELESKQAALMEDTIKRRNSPVSVLLRGPGGRMLSRQGFLELTKHGCAQCGGHISESFANKVRWTRGTPPEPFCHVCSEDERNAPWLNGVA